MIEPHKEAPKLELAKSLEDVQETTITELLKEMKPKSMSETFKGKPKNKKTLRLKL